MNRSETLMRVFSLCRTRTQPAFTLLVDTLHIHTMFVWASVSHQYQANDERRKKQHAQLNRLYRQRRRRQYSTTHEHFHLFIFIFSTRSLPDSDNVCIKTAVVVVAVIDTVWIASVYQPLVLIHMKIFRIIFYFSSISVWQCRFHTSRGKLSNWNCKQEKKPKRKSMMFLLFVCCSSDFPSVSLSHTTSPSFAHSLRLGFTDNSRYIFRFVYTFFPAFSLLYGTDDCCGFAASCFDYDSFT